MKELKVCLSLSNEKQAQTTLSNAIKHAEYAGMKAKRNFLVDSLAKCNRVEAHFENMKTDARESGKFNHAFENAFVRSLTTLILSFV